MDATISCAVLIILGVGLILEEYRLTETDKYCIRISETFPSLAEEDVECLLEEFV
ncbi:MAG: hypothetical protein OXU23_03445 [Candidatus Poribacteria bacterium]|nr:hypothetical protein [Candidatus Poribacteria bacterium]